MSTPSLRVLSAITCYSKYQRYNPTLGRKETWGETIERNRVMHLTRYANVMSRHPALRGAIDDAYQMVRDYKILPSMRSMQLAGTPIARQHARIYNCAYLPIRDTLAFSEAIYLLLCGTGVGYSVQQHHIDQLPSVRSPRALHCDTRIHVVGDSIEGWGDAVRFLFEAFMPDPAGDQVPYWPEFDLSQVRPKGSIIHSVWQRAPGPDPLNRVLHAIRDILASKSDKSRLRPIEAMDMADMLSEVVLAGGVRRSAMICLFSPDDEEMLAAKSGEWWQHSPWRARSNNSAVIYSARSSNTNMGTTSRSHRGGVGIGQGGDADLKRARNDFDRVWAHLSGGGRGSGEPGFLFTNEGFEGDLGTNPCSETSLRPYQFCNLTEVNTATIADQADFDRRARGAALLGTLQAGYTDMPYLTSRWRHTTEEDALLGIGLTGITNGAIHQLEEAQAARSAVDENDKWALTLGINPAARVTCTKPSGTTSLVFGCASGIHALHSPYYIRRIRVNKLEPMYEYLTSVVPELIEDEVGNEQVNAVLSLPIHAEHPDAIYRGDETAIDFLERVARYQRGWVQPGHRSGPNTHSISATASIRPHEWDDVKTWLWENRGEAYSCISCFPADTGASIYAQTPYEECTPKQYREMAKHVGKIDLSAIDEGVVESSAAMGSTGRKYQSLKVNLSVDVAPACAGGVCEL